MQSILPTGVQYMLCLDLFNKFPALDPQHESSLMQLLRGGPFDTQGGGRYVFSFSANYFFHFRDQTINVFPLWIRTRYFPPPSGMKHSIGLLNFFFSCVVRTNLFLHYLLNKLLKKRFPPGTPEEHVADNILEGPTSSWGIVEHG